MKPLRKFIQLRRWLYLNRLNIRKWAIITIFILVGPLTIWWFRSPGKKPDVIPILTIVNQQKKPLPLSITINEDFDVAMKLDLYPLSANNWKRLDILFPPGARNIVLEKRGIKKQIVSDGSFLYKHYDEGPTQLNIPRELLDSMLRKTFPEDENYFESQIVFDLDNAIINNSFSNKSLVLFYLSSAWKDSLRDPTYTVNLNTPLNVVLNSSIPSAARILPLTKNINYDFDVATNDSGLLFNFTDTSHSIFEEISLFIISSVFGFFSGFLFEQILIKQNKPA